VSLACVATGDYCGTSRKRSYLSRRKILYTIYPIAEPISHQLYAFISLHTKYSILYIIPSSQQTASALYKRRSCAKTFVPRDKTKRRSVAACEVLCLTLEDCWLEDGGAALVESVRQGRGPRELKFLRGHPFRSTESFFTFMNALRGNENLERLRFPASAITRSRKLSRLRCMKTKDSFI
jgi:hypothetical protein